MTKQTLFSNLLNIKLPSYITIIFGLFLLFESFESFIVSVDLYKSFRFDRDFNGCIFAGRQEFPFLKIILSFLLLFYGLILIKRFNILFKILIIFTLSITIYHILCSLVSMYFYFFTDGYFNYKILEFGGILFFTFLICEYYNYDWKTLIKKFGYLKIVVSVIAVFIFINFLNVI